MSSELNGPIRAICVISVSANPCYHLTPKSDNDNLFTDTQIGTDYTDTAVNAGYQCNLRYPPALRSFSEVGCIPDKNIYRYYS